MRALANYRFLPWSRRGLVAEIETPDPLNAALVTGRGAIRVAVCINNGAPVAAPEIATYGPGDVIGIDPRVIVRTEPRAYTADFEPNYLAAIDFDAPDFPWMLTPAAPNVSDGPDGRPVHRLRPWLVLLVFDRELVEPPTVKRGQPLPSIEIDATTAAVELPNLEESWAWAHAQVSVGADFAGDLAEHIASAPDLNVSRLVCPRRLRSLRRYLACLLPAFDQGVVRGLGGQPDTSTSLEPAWSSATPMKIELPVYFHWEFSTGPAGDFEELARRLKPIRPTEQLGQLGYQKIYLNPKELELDGLGPDQETAYTWIEGALGVPIAAGSTPPAPGKPGAALETIPQAIRDQLARRLDEPVAIAAGLATDATQALGPPIYGGWPANEHAVGDTTSLWLSELNLDPRARVAAGLGAEVVRRNQEDFMQACWEQVDEVLKANDILNRARLAQEVGHRLFTRFFSLRSAEQLVGMMAPMHGHIRDGQATIDLAVRRSSLPNSAFDPALRRLISAQRPWIKRALRAGGQDARGARSASLSFTALLNQDGRDADPTRFMPDGLAGTRALSRVGADTAGQLDFNVVGLKATLDAPAAQALTLSAQRASTNLAQGFAPLALSPTLDQTGLLLERHIRDASALADLGLQQSNRPIVLAEVLSELKAVATSNPTAAVLLLSFESGTKPTVNPMLLEPGGNLVIDMPGTGPTVIGQIEPGLSGADLGLALADLPPGTLVGRPGPGDLPIVIGLSGPGVVPRAVLIPGLGPGPIQHPGAGIQIPGQGPIHIPGPGPGPIQVPGPDPGHIQIPGPGPGPIQHPDTGIQIPGPGQGPIHIPGPGQDPIQAPGPDPGPIPIPGPVPEPIPIPGPGPGPIQLPHLTNTTIPPIREPDVLQRYKGAFKQYQDAFGAATPPPATTFEPMAFAGTHQTLLTRTNPLTTIPARIRTMVRINGHSIGDANQLDVIVPATIDRIMVGPKIRQPMYAYLAAYDGQRFFPGIDQLPQDSVVLLATNPRFVEAFMVGLSHEMNRELLWRSYPTDQRGTVFQRFWSWADEADDIPMIHTWGRDSSLGKTARQVAGGSQIVLLIRGQLLRRYPGTVMLAWPGEERDGRLQLKADPSDGEVLAPIFSGRFAPDFTFFGFPLTPEDIANGKWFLVLQQQPMEPRFGFDTPATDRSGDLSSWLDATWEDVGTAEGAYLRLAGNPLAGKTLPPDSLNGVTFGRDAGHLGAVLLQRPFRAALDAKKLMTQLR